MMHLGIDFWEDLGGFLEEKWRHVGTKIGQKSIPISKSDFLKKHYFPEEKPQLGGLQGSKLRVKIDQKSMPKMESR